MSNVEAAVIAGVLLAAYAIATHAAMGLAGRRVPFEGLQAAIVKPHQSRGLLRPLGLIVMLIVAALTQITVVGGLLESRVGEVSWLLYAVEIVIASLWSAYVVFVAARPGR